MKTIYLLRHGEINPGKPRKFIGQTDLSLIPEGREQMSVLGSFLHRRTTFDQIVSSPLSRCLESSELLNRSLKTITCVEPDLAEIHLGDWEGLTAEQVREKFPGEYEARGADMAGYSPAGGESFQDLQDRVWPVLQKIIAQVETAAVVSHAGVQRVLLCRILGIPLDNLFRIKQDYGCYNILHVDEDHIQLACLNGQVL